MRPSSVERSSDSLSVLAARASAAWWRAARRCSTPVAWWANAADAAPANASASSSVASSSRSSSLAASARTRTGAPGRRTSRIAAGAKPTPSGPAIAVAVSPHSCAWSAPGRGERRRGAERGRPARRAPGRSRPRRARCAPRSGSEISAAAGTRSSARASSASAPASASSPGCDGEREHARDERRGCPRRSRAGVRAVTGDRMSTDRPGGGRSTDWDRHRTPSLYTGHQSPGDHRALGEVAEWLKALAC